MDDPKNVPCSKTIEGGFLKAINEDSRLGELCGPRERGSLQLNSHLGQKHLAGWQTTQGGQEKQRDYIIKKITSFVIKSPLRCLLLSKVSIGERTQQHVRPLPHPLRPQLSRPRRLSLKWASAKYKLEGTRNESVDVIPEMILEFVKFSFHLISG